MFCVVGRRSMIFFYVAWHQSCQIMIVSDSVSVFWRVDTGGVILIGNVSTTDHCLIVAEMKGYQVSKLFMGN